MTADLGPRARIAALYDVHGNLPALEAVLTDVGRERPDRIVVGGDVAMGPFPEQTLDALRALGDRVAFLRGNADREVSGERPVPGSTPWAERAAWVHDRLGAARRGFLATLPLTLEANVAEMGPVLFCHATPRSDEEIVTRVTSEERARDIYAGVDAATVVFGHTHVQFDRRLGRHRLVNPGSVGMPYEGRVGAFWAMIGPEVSLRETSYDVGTAARAIRASGFPDVESLVEMVLLRPRDPDEVSTLFERMALEAAARSGGGS